MANIPISMLLAQSTGLTPEDRKKAQDLARQQAGQDAAAVGEEALALNPAFQPPEKQGFSLAGNAPVGGAGGIGSALLGNAPPTAPGTEQPGMEQPKRKRLEEMQSWERLQKQQAKYDKIPWFAPSQLKDRLSSDMGRTLDMLRLEMADAGAEQHDAQYYANLLSSTKREEKRDDLTAQQLREAAEERKKREERLEKELGLRTREAELRRDDIAEGREERRSAAQQAATAQGQAAYRSTMTHDPLAVDPSATGVFGRFAAEALKNVNPKTGAPPPPEAIRSAQVQASRSGALPPMMSSKADAPRTAVDPKTGKRIWVFPDGRIREAE